MSRESCVTLPSVRKKEAHRAAGTLELARAKGPGRSYSKLAEKHPCACNLRIFVEAPWLLVGVRTFKLRI